MSLRTFFKSEDGAVSVDYVVLTAAVVAITVAFAVQFDDETQAVEDSIGAAVLAQKI